MRNATRATGPMMERIIAVRAQLSSMDPLTRKRLLDRISMPIDPWVLLMATQKRGGGSSTPPSAHAN